MTISEVLLPSTFEEAKLLLNKNKNIKVLAGGTDLLLVWYQREQYHRP